MKYMHGIIMKLLRVAHAAVSVFQLEVLEVTEVIEVILS